MNLQSNEINELASALCKAQSRLNGAKKESTNPFYKSKYADLEAVWDACREPLTSNGLSVVQQIQYENEKTLLVTTLVHSSGQWMRSFAPVLTAKNDAQGLGAGITYMRRYALCAMVGITQEDDDGESAIDRKKQIANLKSIKENKISSEKANAIREQISVFENEIQDKIYGFISNELKAVNLESVLETHVPILEKKIMATKRARMVKNEEAIA